MAEQPAAPQAEPDQERRRPAPLTAAAWLSYAPAFLDAFGSGGDTLRAVLLALPWILTAQGLFRGALWSWRAGLFLAGAQLLFALLLLARPPAVPGITPEQYRQGMLWTLAALFLFLAVYVRCLLAPVTRRFIEAGRNFDAGDSSSRNEA